MSSSKADKIINIIGTVIGTILVSAIGTLVFETEKISLLSKIIIFLILALLLLFIYNKTSIIEQYKKFRNFDEVNKLRSEISNQRNELFRYRTEFQNAITEIKESIGLIEKNANIIDESITKQDIFVQIQNIKTFLQSLEEFENFIQKFNQDLTEAENITISKKPSIESAMRAVRESNQRKEEQTTNSDHH
jgi:hypothetical protein